MTNQNRLFHNNKKEYVKAEEFNGTYNKNNSLNNLTGKNWLKFTKTWFVYDGPIKSNDEMLHPAKYPEGMIEEFIKFFTKEGDIVLDPFLGTGSTLVAANHCGRNGIGIELLEKYANIARKRVKQKSLVYNVKQNIIVGNSLNTKEIWDKNNLSKVDFVICSPPYWNMLKKSRGGVVSAQKERANKGLDTIYSERDDDLGNIDNYNIFVKKLGEVFIHVTEILKENKYLVVIIQNLRDNDGTIKTLAWDTAKEIKKIPFMLFQGEKIWCQSNKKLGIWGYPKIFIPNYHHHYCLIFKKRKQL